MTRLFTLTLWLTLASITFAEQEKADANWWSLQPLRNVQPPTLNESNPIDAFIRAKLTAAGMKHADPADRTTLIRRVTFDLIGLPPTPGEIDAFVSDTSVDAYERLVDRLLASPAYGERWARHWLDVVRYSESHGFEYDRLRDHAWRYRDYAVRSFNDDKPYSQFVREQLAGDLMPDAGVDGVIATGMLVAGPFDQAGMGSVSALIRAKAREDELEDMIGLVSQTFLGATMNCARCHDHKFDPYTARDYYRMKAVLAGVFPGDRPAMSAQKASERQEMIAKLERKLAGAKLRSNALESAARKVVLQKRGENVKDAVAVKPIARWSFDSDGRDSIGTLHAELKNGASIANGRLAVDGRQAFAATGPVGRDLRAKTLEAWVALPMLSQGGGGVISVQTLNGGTFDAIVFGENTPKRWMAGSNGFVRTRDVGGPLESAANQLVHIAIAYDGNGKVTLYRNGAPYGDAYTIPEPQGKVGFTAKEFQVVFGMRHTGGGNAFLRGEIEEARLYDLELSVEQIRDSFRAGVERISIDELRAAMSEGDRRVFDDSLSAIAKLEPDLVHLQRPTLTYAATAKPHPKTHVLKRGDVEKLGDVVTPGSPVVIKGPPQLDAANDADSRLAFADWIVHRDNPLAWRVIVNRVWQQHFGAGLVRSPSDFGFNGDKPTHPELLDWLAAWFRDSDGSLKRLHRLIVTSQTYQQSTRFDKEAAAKDVDNQMLWRFAPRRLEAEAIRDAMLSASGKLNREAGGPSFRPFRIETFNSAFYIPIDEDRQDFNRRSVYRMNVTSSRDPVLDVLDCPDPSVKTPRRSVTTTPLQALTLMNNSFTNRLAKSFAERVQREVGNDVGNQITLAYRLALGRTPTNEQRTLAEKTAREQGLHVVCWALFNSNEFVYMK